jgi:hypothetical protein
MTLQHIFTVIGIVIGIACAPIHIISVFMKNRFSAYIFYTGILLHILLFVSLFLAKISLSVITLVFMGSVCIYTVSSYVKHSLNIRAEEEKRNNDI